MAIVPIRLHTPEVGSVALTVDERGAGRPFLLLHGGAGPRSVTGLAELIAARRPAHVLAPVHPGFDGTPRPGGLRTIAQLAELYLALLDALDLREVTVVGNSIGGWIAAEMALGATDRVGGVVLVDAVGIEVPGHPVADPFALTMAEVFARSYHDPARFAVDPATLPPEQRRALAANFETLAVYAGPSMADPGLAGRLARVTVPALVVWGESDRIADAVYGRAYAAAIAGAEFELLRGTGHLPQIETPEPLLQTLWRFAERHAAARA